jgi:hypothetical protein
MRVTARGAITQPEWPSSDKPTEEIMAITIAQTVTSRSETHHTFRDVAIAFFTRFVEAARQRREERRMMLIVQEMDHPGVLADVEAVRRVQVG